MPVVLLGLAGYLVGKSLAPTLDRTYTGAPLRGRITPLPDCPTRGRSGRARSGC